MAEIDGDLFRERNIRPNERQAQDNSCACRLAVDRLKLQQVSFIKDDDCTFVRDRQH
jgi:hypothetical protein